MSTCSIIGQAYLQGLHASPLHRLGIMYSFQDTGGVLSEIWWGHHHIVSGLVLMCMMIALLLV